MIALLATLLIYTEFYIFTESKLNSISFNSMNSSVSKMSTRGPENLNECIEYTSRSGIAGSYESSIFNFWGPSILIFIKAVPVYLPTNSVQELIFLLILSTLVFHILNTNLPSRCELISYCSFDSHILDS